MRPNTTRRHALLRWSALATLLALPIGAVPGCGGEEAACTTIGCQNQSAAPVMAMGGSGTGAAPSGGFVDGENASGQGGTSSLGTGAVCREVTFPATVSPINVLILLDRSTSMLEPVDPNVPGAPTRWDAVTSALRSFVNSAQATDARVGLQFFGLTNGLDDCGVDKYTTPAVAVAPLVGNRAALLQAIDATRPGSFTPTQPAIEGALRYALGVAQLPENADVPTVVVLASDGIPSECGPVVDGVMITSFAEIISTLRSFSQPPLDAAGDPTQPPIITYLVGTEDLKANAKTLAEAGGGQAFLVGGAAGSGTDLEAKFLDALLRIVVKPLDCEIDVPQTASDTGERVDFEKVRVQFTGAASGATTEFPRTRGPGDCGTDAAWFYDDNAAPEKIFFCRKACESLGAGDLKLELGCSPQMILR